MSDVYANKISKFKKIQNDSVLKPIAMNMANEIEEACTANDYRKLQKLRKQIKKREHKPTVTTSSKTTAPAPAPAPPTTSSSASPSKSSARPKKKKKLCRQRKMHLRKLIVAKPLLRSQSWTPMTTTTSSL